MGEGGRGCGLWVLDFLFSGSILLRTKPLLDASKGARLYLWNHQALPCGLFRLEGVS